MLHVDPRVDDPDGDSGSGRGLPGVGGMDLGQAPLIAEVGVVAGQSGRRADEHRRAQAAHGGDGCEEPHPRNGAP